MSVKNNIFLFATSFLGGLAAGLLLAPQKGAQNRAWLSNNAEALGKWARLQQQIARRKSNQELSKIRNNVQQGVRQYIPDLYEATNDIPLSEKDIMDE